MFKEPLDLQAGLQIGLRVEVKRICRETIDNHQQEDSDLPILPVIDGS